MDIISIVIIVASIGLFIAGVFILNNKRLKNIINESKLYGSAEKFIRFNGYFYIIIALIGICLGVANEILDEKNSLIAPIFMVLITASSLVQYKFISKIRNIMK